MVLINNLQFFGYFMTPFSLEENLTHNDASLLRQQIRAHYQADEEQVIGDLLAQSQSLMGYSQKAEARSKELVQAVRNDQREVEEGR